MTLSAHTRKSRRTCIGATTGVPSGCASTKLSQPYQCRRDLGCHLVRRGMVAGVTHAIIVGIVLTAINHLWAVVTGITDPVFILIFLV